LEALFTLLGKGCLGMSLCFSWPRLGVDRGLVKPARLEEAKLARSPRDSSLGISKLAGLGLAMPPTREAVLVGVLNFSLALPSLVCPPIRGFYALSCRYVAGRCRAAYMGIPARASDCKGVLVLHLLYGVELAMALSRMLCRGCVFIDVGAHVGRYALRPPGLWGLRAL